MLTLAHPRRVRAPLVLHRVGGWRLSADLQRYLEHALGSRWPGVSLIPVRTPSGLQQDDVDLWLCGEAPGVITHRPALVFGAVSRNARLVQLGAQLWTCATPLNAHVLIWHIERVLAD